MADSLSEIKCIQKNKKIYKKKLTPFTIKMMKNRIKDWTPPIVWRFMRKQYHQRSKLDYEWEYISDNWDESLVQANARGWNVQDVLDVYKKNWALWMNSLDAHPSYLASPEALDFNQFDLVFHNTLMCYAYALAYAAHQKTSISMLDWGGGIGHYYRISQVLMPDLNIIYSCKETPVLAEYGQSLFPEAGYYSDESCLKQKYDFVLTSASLHYSQDWRTTFAGLANSTSGYLFVTRIPMILNSQPFVFIQRPYQYGYNTEYLGWCLNRGEFLDQARFCGLTLVREFVTGEQPDIIKAPENCIYRGFLFQPHGLDDA